MRWFRLYNEMIDDLKVQRLPGELFKALINLWCIASQNSGRLPDLDEITFRLRYVTGDVTVTILNDLEARGFIDRDEHGWYPHNWGLRQPGIDDVALRMRKYRKRKQQLKIEDKRPLRNALQRGDKNVYLLEQNREEKKESKESESKQYDSGGRSATRPKYDEAFEHFWATYPKRRGSNPKQPAYKKFLAALKSGVELQTIMAGVRHYVNELRSQNKIGTEFVAQAMTWLNQSRWEAAQQMPLPLEKKPLP